jgi:hypothetical protein
MRNHFIFMQNFSQIFKKIFAKKIGISQKLNILISIKLFNVI